LPTPVQNQPAYLLHWRPYSESSLLLDLFSRSHGRLALLAKGARRPKSRSRGALLPFQPLLASWSGKGELQVLTGVEVAVVQGVPKGDELACAYYLNELLLKLLQRFDPHENLFDAYGTAIGRLLDPDDEIGTTERALRVFEKALLRETGFGLILDRDANSGSAVDPKRKYRYLPERGPVAMEEAGVEGLPIHGETLHALRDESFQSRRSLNESKQLTRMLLRRQLAGRDLRCRQVMLQMSRYRVSRQGVE